MFFVHVKLGLLKKCMVPQTTATRYEQISDVVSLSDKKMSAHLDNVYHKNRCCAKKLISIIF